MVGTDGVVYLLLSLVQEAGVALGLGAITITLVAHLLALHSRQDEATRGYVHSAMQARSFALMLIILSGVGAILFHILTATPGTLIVPAFLFKWLLIGLLTSFYFLEKGASGYRQDVVEGLEGANWYALFIVHSIAPIVAWGLLLEIYIGWLVAFAIVWVLFVWFMRRQATSKQVPGAKVEPAITAGAEGAGVSMSRRSSEVKDGDSGAPAPAAKVSPILKPVPPPVLAPIKVEKKIIEVHPNHSMLPMLAELDLPAPPPVSTPAPLPPSLPPEPPSLPAINVMPKKPEDIQ